VLDLGLRKQFDHELNVKLWINSLAALTFIPPNEVRQDFNALCKNFPQTVQRVDELLAYFQTAWVNGPG